ncbi:MAG: hypothetical protein LBV08_06170, partial [Clostridiales bacterium]|nr:hypothetical protein [Clostridiales bacterium]
MLNSDSLLENMRNKVMETIKGPTLTYMQKVFALAALSESLMEVLDKPKALLGYKEDGIICDL